MPITTKAELKESSMKLTFPLASSDAVMNDFVAQVPVSKEFKKECVAAYTDKSKTKRLPVDASDLNSKGVLHIRMDVSPKSTAFIEYDDSFEVETDDTNNHIAVWSGCTIFKNEDIKDD